VRAQCSTFTGIGAEAESSPVTLRIKYGIIPKNSWYFSQSGCGIKSGINTTFLARNCGSVGPKLTIRPRRTGFNEYMPQGQRTLTEVDGVVEIGPVGPPATQKEVAPAQANTSDAQA